MWKGTIKLITENTVYNKKMLAEEGLSVFVEELSPEPIKILFDSGRNFATLQHNLNVMAESLDDIKVIVTSHGHAGHIQALNDLIQRTQKPKLITNSNIFYKKYKKKVGQFSPGGVVLNHLLLQKYTDLIETDKPYQITEHIWTSGHIKIYQPAQLGISEKDKYWRKVNGKLVLDLFEEETALFIKSDFGIIIVTACGHRGIGNTIETAQELFKGQQIAAVIGGFHTMDRPEALDVLRERLLSERVQRVMPCHCTGIYGKLALLNTWKENYFDVSTGSVLEIENDIILK